MTLVPLVATIGFGLLAIVAAFVALVTRSTTVAVIAAGLVSLFASVIYLALAAPDVAMTEAAIGSGLTTFLFFYVLGRMRREGGHDQ
ncbi:MAG: hydrogenase subunit MbhD domain-containing protein [Paracoccaceae bacterium]